MAVRLPDDVAAAVEQAAKEQERSKSAVVVRALRAALDVNQNENWKGISKQVEDAVKTVKNDGFRTSPDGKPCKHRMFRCDKGCWK